MESMASEYTGASHGHPPSLYDTSTSTADSNSSSSARYYHKQQASASYSTRTTETTSMSTSNSNYGQQQQRQSGRYSTPPSRYPRVRKSVSDSGVSTEYDRYIQKASHLHVPASDLGAGTTAEQIRNFNRLRRNGDPELQFVVDNYHHEQLSYGPSVQTSSSFSFPAKNDRESQTREFYSAPHIEGKTGKKSLAQHYGEMRAKKNLLEQRNSAQHGPVSRDPDDSFGSSIETPSTASVQDIKKQLWSNEEVLQVSIQSPGGRLDQKLARERQPSRTFSTGRAMIRKAGTFESDNTANFKSKYYEAAMVARGSASITSIPRDFSPVTSRATVSRSRTNSRGDETQVTSISSPYDEGGRSNVPRDFSPVTSRATVSRSRTDSRGDETQVTSISSPYDERGRSNVRSSSRSQDQPASLNMPPLHSSNNEDGGAGAFRRPPERHETRSKSDAYRETTERRPHIAVREQRDQNVEAARVRSRSIPRNFEQDESRPRRRSPSPLIKQRVQEFSQEPRGRNKSPPPLPNTKSRSRSLDPRSKDSRASVERLALGFGQEMLKPNGSRSSGRTPPQRQSWSHDSHVPYSSEGGRGLSSIGSHSSNASQPHPLVESEVSDSPYGSESFLPREPIRRMTTIRDGPSKRSSSLDRRPPTPIDRSMPKDGRSREEPEIAGDSRSKQHEEIAAYWQEKARASPTFPIPDPATTFRSRPSDEGSQIERDGVFGSEPAVGYVDHNNVADLVAKLSAVNRANPSQALAQIDSILRQESTSHAVAPDQAYRGGLGEVGQRQSPNPFGGEEVSSQMDDEYSDDETSVSSITNPTFQSSGKPYHDEVRILSSQAQFAQDQESRSSKNFSPSTSTFRRPRPSGLNNYVTPKFQPVEMPTRPHEEGKSLRKAKERREQMRKHPPPLTINVKDSNDASSSERAPKSDKFEDHRVRVTVTQASTEGRARPPSPLRSFDERVRVTVTRQERRENEHVEKPGDEPQQAYALKPLPALTKSHRAHPWDGEIPARVERVETRDTSMENAAGVETAMPVRRGLDLDDSRLRSPEISMAEESASPKSSRAPIEHPVHDANRQARRDQSLIEAFPYDPAIFFDTGFGRKKAEDFPTEASTESKPTGLFEFDAWASALLGGDIAPGKPSGAIAKQQAHDPPSPQQNRPPTNDAKKQPARPKRQEPPEPQPAWLSPPKNDTKPKRDLDTSDTAVDLDDSVDSADSFPQRKLPELTAKELKRKSDIERGAIEVSLISDEDEVNVSAETSQAAQTVEIFDPRETRAISCMSLGLGQDKLRTKGLRRGFLGAFKRKEKNKSKATMGSKDAQTLPASNARPLPTIRLHPLSPAYYPDVSAEIERGRADKRLPPQLSRPASLERFRSPNMAQKFGRVLELYD